MKKRKKVTQEFTIVGEIIPKKRGKLDIPVEELEKNINEFVERVSGMLGSVKKLGDQYRLDCVEIDAALTADGRVQLVGSSAGASIKGGLKFVWKNKDQ